MKLYTVTETDYNVVILKTLKHVWEHIQKYRGIDGEIYTDVGSDKFVCSEKILRQLLQEEEPVNIYTIGDSIRHDDWVIQISKHYEQRKEKLNVNS